MSIRPINILLPEQLDQYVRERVESGTSNSPSEVIQEALWLLREQDAIYKMRLEELKKEVAIGVEQANRGECVQIDFKELRARAQKRLEELRHSSAAKVSEHV